ncbi:MAG TPA: hypothetical protein VNI52_12360 [Sphingobacteriaceae bacterium]|nr:hypothetical protein [Sphingobacteriaceae bacterium]
MKIRYLILIFLIISCGRGKTPEVVFDISAQTGLSIDEIRKKLVDGQNGVKASPDYKESEGIDIYIKNGKNLYIYYDRKSREVISFLLVSTDEKFAKIDDILKIGNLDTINPAYSLEADKSFWDRDTYSSVTVYPKK